MADPETYHDIDDGWENRGQVSVLFELDEDLRQVRVTGFIAGPKHSKSRELPISSPSEGPFTDVRDVRSVFVLVYRDDGEDPEFQRYDPEIHGQPSDVDFTIDSGIRALEHRLNNLGLGDLTAEASRISHDPTGKAQDAPKLMGDNATPKQKKAFKRTMLAYAAAWSSPQEHKRVLDQLDE